MSDKPVDKKAENKEDDSALHALKDLDKEAHEYVKVSVSLLLAVRTFLADFFAGCRNFADPEYV